MNKLTKELKSHFSYNNTVILFSKYSVFFFNLKKIKNKKPLHGQNFQIYFIIIPSMFLLSAWYDPDMFMMSK